MITQHPKPKLTTLSRSLFRLCVESNILPSCIQPEWGLWRPLVLSAFRNLSNLSPNGIPSRTPAGSCRQGGAADSPSPLFPPQRKGESYTGVAGGTEIRQRRGLLTTTTIFGWLLANVALFSRHCPIGLRPQINYCLRLC